MATTDLTPGAVLGEDRYRLERPLGAGGMAIVWLAEDERLGRRVAIKVLSDVLAADAAYLRRFEREARIAAQLSHPNLVRLFDYSAEAQRPFLVMEYVEGTTVADLLGHGVALDVDRLASELLSALAHIHGAGIIHRDVKPANVLIDKTGRVKLTDFGIAQAADASRLTRTGNVIGTLRYLAPEIIDGEPATPRSDLYACGVLLREALRSSRSAAVAGLSERLAATDPEARPERAEDAIALLEDPSGVRTTPMTGSNPRVVDRTSKTAVLDQARGARDGRPATREFVVDQRRALIALGVVAIALLIVVLAVSSGGDSPPAPAEATERSTPAPSAPLREQLRALDAAVEDAAR